MRIATVIAAAVVLLVALAACGARSDPTPPAAAPSVVSPVPAPAPPAAAVPAAALAPAFPEQAAGFVFGHPMTEAQSACTGAQRRWRGLSHGNGVCFGSPAPVPFAISQALLVSCSGALCQLMLIGEDLSGGDAAYIGAFQHLVTALDGRYPGAQQEPRHAREDATCVELFERGDLMCIRTGQAIHSRLWRLRGGVIVLTLQQKDNGRQQPEPEPELMLAYQNETADAQAQTADHAAAANL